MEPLPIQDVIDRAIAATSALFQSKPIELIPIIEADLPHVVGDRDRLIQVVINLISNAVKFTDEGNIICRVSLVNTLMQVSITDSGIGIALDDQPKVFEKFKQVGDTLTDKPKGTGLGLPICKQIVEHHNGSIWVESELGKGSTFSFSLPALAVAEPTTRKIDLSTLMDQLRTRDIPSSDRMILVVDDEAPIRQLLRQHLETESYRVMEAANGREAIAMSKEHRPHLIILDIMMPELNGFDVAAALKTDPQTMDIPIIILSIVEDMERGKRLKVDRYLTKPINTDLLLHEINSLITQGSVHRKVLIVDDNDAVVKALVDVLQAKGFSVIEAANDDELLEKALSDQPDLVIANAQFWEHSTAVKTLKQVKGLENILLLLVAENSPNAPILVPQS